MAKSYKEIMNDNKTFLLDIINNIQDDNLEQNIRNINIDINKKFRPFGTKPENDVVVMCNCDDLLADQNRFNFLTMLPMVMFDNNAEGTFKYDVFDISVNKLIEYQF